jgi:hypothetical protein
VTEFRARIGRVRMKNGGADVRVIDRQAVNSDGEDWRGTLLRNARAVADFATDDVPLIGYLLVGLYADASSSVGFRYDMDRCAVPVSRVPAWVAELLRRDMITKRQAEETFDDKFEWVER